MSKNSSLFVCQSCGWSTPAWLGQCSECGAWNSLVEEVQHSANLGSTTQQTEKLEKILIPLPQVEALSGSKRRLSTTIDEFDRVLGGFSVQEATPTQKKTTSAGMVAGAVMLIGGEPGIGKSTLLTQVVVGMLSEHDRPLLYVCGEENPAQIALRIKRIVGTKKIPQERLIFVTSTDVGTIVAAIRKLKPVCVVVDSIQTVTTAELSGAAGSVGQVRESAEQLTHVAKEMQVPLFLVGHVTKEGSLSGPKVLEHIVDSVIELSGDRTSDLRILRAVKNRFGATDEVGVFRMNEFGFESVANPSELFLEHAASQVAGSAVACIMEGTRPLLLEIQALVVHSQLAMPRRVGRGISLPRIQVLSAVLQKHCRLPLATTDIFASVAGGLQIQEPSIDLGLAVAITSSLHNKPLPLKTAFIAEVGLLGEIRSVNLLDKRIKEAERQGFTTIFSKKTHKTVAAVLAELQLLKK